MVLNYSGRDNRLANQEQFNISIRWVGEHFIVDEDPIGMVAVPDTTGDTLFRVVKDSLIRMNLPIKNCRGQAYDGASNMQGNFKGVATRIQQEEYLLLFIITAWRIV